MPMEINVEPGLVPHHFAGMVYRPSSSGLATQNQRLLLLGTYEALSEKEGEEDSYDAGLKLISAESDIAKHYPNPESTIARMLQASFEANPSVERYGLVVEKDLLEEAFSSLPEWQFTQIASSLNSPYDLMVANEHLEKRWDSVRQIDGHYFACVKGKVSELIEGYRELKTLAHVSVMVCSNSSSDASVWAATLAAVNARYANKPYLPYQSLPLTGIEAPRKEHTLAQRDLLLKAGLSTHSVESGVVKIDRLVTMHSKDPSLRDLNKKQILSYLRYDFVQFLKQMYPRHALSNDDTQADGDVATPKSARDLAIARHLKWKKDKYVQDDGGEFKNLVRVWIDEKSPDSLRFYLPVQLMGQLRRTITTIAFTP